MSDSIIVELRAATHASHVRLEAMLDLVGTGITRSRYLAILRVFLSVYSPVEKQLQEMSLRESRLKPASLESRKKVPLLLSDLRSFGELANAGADDIAVSESMSEQFTVESAERAVGVMYVLEGATLGGQYIVPHVRQHLSLTASQTRFFSSYGADVAGQWQQFRSFANSFATASSQRHLIIQGAVDMFCHLEHSCERALTSLSAQELSLPK